MGMMLVVEAFGEKELARELLRFDERAHNLMPAWEGIHKAFLNLEGRQFSSEGRYSGGWAPLADSTVKAKERAGLDPHILQATGHLMASLTEEGAEDHVFRVEPEGIYMGSNDPVGRFHQSRAPRHHLPRRPPVDIPAASKRYWIQILQRYIIEGFAPAGGVGGA